MCAAKTRIPFWDNARWLAMALVVIGHVVQPLALDSNLALSPYLVIYAFHMPLFATISGYFTTAAPERRHFVKIVTELLAPYLIFETIWTIVRYFVHGHATFDLTTPSWTLWFLLALAAFRLLMPVLAVLRWPLLWAVLVSIAIGYLDDVDQTFSAMRMLGMLTFFVLGWQLREWGLMDRWFRARRTLPLRAAALSVFGVALALGWALPGLWRESKLRHWFFLDRPYSEIGDGMQPADGLIRLLLLGVTTLLIAAALLLVPRSATWFSAWGGATMTIYLLHTFVLYWPRESGWLRSLAPEWWATPAAVVAGLAITVLLSQPVVVRATSWLTQPRLGALLRPADTARS